MTKKVTDHASADRLLLAAEIQRRKTALAQQHRPSGRDEAVVRTASARDQLKVIPARMN